MKINNIAVAHKLWTLFLGINLCLVVVALGVLWNMERTKQDEAQILADSNARIDVATRWKAIATLSSERIAVHMMSSESHVGDHIQQLNAAATTEINALSENIDRMLTTPAERALLTQITQARAATRAVAGRAREARSQGNMEAATHIVQRELLPASASYEQLQQQLIDLLRAEQTQANAASAAAITRSYWLGAAISAAVIALGIWMAALLLRSISRPLNQAVELSQRIASGDLTGELHETRKDELGLLLQSLSAMTHKLRTVVGEVRTGVAAVSAASTEIASGSLDLSNRTEQTASSLEQTAASMEELTATVGQSFETARQANQLVNTAAQAAAQGGAVVEQVVQSMASITDSSRRINDIIGVIDSIAFQTNILALNAAVEAARAGEQGRGFAVVASEVRSLAGRSAEAAKEIKALITTSVNNVENGSQQVSQAGASMQEIVQSVRRVSDLMSEITAAASEQRDGITQVNQAVGHLDQMTQQNAALVEQSSAAASGMHAQAQHLEEVVAQFKLHAHHNSTYTPPALAPATHAGRSAVPRPAAPRAAAIKASTTATATAKTAAKVPSKTAPALTPSSADNNSDWESF